MRASLGVLAALLFIASKSPEVVVTCALPGDSLLWPIQEGAAPVVVATEFVSSDELLRIRRGNFFEITTQIAYRVTGSKSEFPRDEISFILREHWPTPESGIKVKRVGNPFVAGTKARFWLDRPEHPDVWMIQSYKVERTDSL